jgi:hypothetical protein
MQTGPSAEIPSLLWKQKPHHIYNPPPVPNPSPVNTVHNPTPYFLKIDFNIILQRLGFPNSFPTNASKHEKLRNVE